MGRLTQEKRKIAAQELETEERLLAVQREIVRLQHTTERERLCVKGLPVAGVSDGYNCYDIIRQ